jgi:hypothetical protein
MDVYPGNAKPVVAEDAATVSRRWVGLRRAWRPGATRWRIFTDQPAWAECWAGVSLL